MSKDIVIGNAEREYPSKLKFKIPRLSSSSSSDSKLKSCGSVYRSRYALSNGSSSVSQQQPPPKSLNILHHRSMPRVEDLCYSLSKSSSSSSDRPSSHRRHHGKGSKKEKSSRISDGKEEKHHRHRRHHKEPHRERATLIQSENVSNFSSESKNFLKKSSSSSLRGEETIVSKASVPTKASDGGLSSVIELSSSSPSSQPATKNSLSLDYENDEQIPPQPQQQQQPVYVEKSPPMAEPSISQPAAVTSAVFLAPAPPSLAPQREPMPPPPPPQPVYVEIPRTLSSSSSSSENGISSRAVTEVDIFPVLSWDEVPRFDLNMPDSPSQIRTFINILKGHRVYFHVVDSKVWTTNIDRHFTHSQQCRAIVFDKLDWAKVERRLSLRPTSDRHNEDLRLVHRWDNVYLVKSYFTFGQRTPEPQTSHVIQTSASSVLFYELDGSKKFSQHRDDIRRKKKKFSRTVSGEEHSSLRSSRGDDVSPRGFSSYDQYLYERYVLQPFSIYRVPAGTSYVLMTYQKTLFRVDVVPDSVADDMEARSVYRFASPTSDRVARPNSSKGYGVSYNHPPPTPIALSPSTRLVIPQQQQQTQDFFAFQQQQQQNPEELYNVTDEQQLFEQLLKSYEELPQQQQQVITESFMPSTTTADEQLTLYAGDSALVATTTAGEIQQQQQQYTLVLQQPREETSTQTEPPPPKPETRDAAVNTDSLPFEVKQQETCKKCSSFSVSTETVAVQQWTRKRTRGLGIARKRISSCCSSTDPAEKDKSKRMRLDDDVGGDEDKPLDLSCCAGRENKILVDGENFKKSTSCNLPPAPSKSFEDSGLYSRSIDRLYDEQPMEEENDEEEEDHDEEAAASESSDEEGYSGSSSEGEEDDDVGKRETYCNEQQEDLANEQDHRMSEDEISLHGDCGGEEESYRDYDDVLQLHGSDEEDMNISEEDAAVASIVSRGEEFC